MGLEETLVNELFGALVASGRVMRSRFAAENSCAAFLVREISFEALW